MGSRSKAGCISLSPTANTHVSSAPKLQQPFDLKLYNRVGTHSVLLFSALRSGLLECNKGRSNCPTDPKRGAMRQASVVLTSTRFCHTTATTGRAAANTSKSEDSLLPCDSKLGSPSIKLPSRLDRVLSCRPVGSSYSEELCERFFWLTFAMLPVCKIALAEINGYRPRASSHPGYETPQPLAGRQPVAFSTQISCKLRACPRKSRPRISKGASLVLRLPPAWYIDLFQPAHLSIFERRRPILCPTMRERKER